MVLHLLLFHRFILLFLDSSLSEQFYEYAMFIHNKGCKEISFYIKDKVPLKKMKKTGFLSTIYFIRNFNSSITILNLHEKYVIIG